MLNVLRTAAAQAVPTGTVVNPLDLGTEVTIAQIFTLITNIIIGIGIALTVIFLVLGGIQYITSRGDTKQVETARASLTNAIIGFIIVIAAVTIRFVVSNVLTGGSNISGLENVTPF